MTVFLRRGPALLLVAATLASSVACLAPSARDPENSLPRDGIDRYSLTSEEARSLAGCRYGYRVYEPDGGSVAPTVLLGHGFLRDQDTLVDLGRALANAGSRTVTLDFCNMRPWNGHHERNARDMVALARRVEAADVIYAGFSAGALAALLAAAEDPAARGVVTLDLVDQGGLADRALDGLDVPLVGLQGPPSACNANGNGQRVFDRRPEAPLATVAGASHCEFESPTDRLCEIACGDDDSDADDRRVREDIVRRVVDAVRELADPSVPVTTAGQL